MIDKIDIMYRSEELQILKNKINEIVDFINIKPKASNKNASPSKYAKGLIEKEEKIK